MNKQNKIIVGVVALILALTVGYAIFSQSLNINGTAKAQGNLDIVFSEVGEIFYQGANETTTAEITENGKKLVIEGTELNYPTAYVDIPVTIINNGTVDGILESITVENLETDDIKISINGIENNQIVKIYKANDDTTKVKATVRVEWLDKTDTKTESVKNIVVTLNAKQLVKEVVTTSSSSDSFPVVSGSLGDNVTFTYNSGVVSISGYGPMSDEKSSIGLSSKGLVEAISSKIAENYDFESENGRLELIYSLFQVIGGYELGSNETIINSYDDMKYMLIDEGLTEDEADKIVEVCKTVPRIKNITIENGITTLRNLFLTEIKIDSIIFPSTIESINSNGSLGTVVSLNTLYLEDGTKLLKSGIIVGKDSTVINELVIPSTVETIENNAIDSIELTTIINKTGKAFDWNGILTVTSGNAFETGTVEYNGKTITITNK